MHLNKRPSVLDQSHYAPYMNAQTFTKLAQALNLKISVSTLEFLEEERAFFPSVRTVMPDGFPERLVAMHQVRAKAASIDSRQWFSSPRIMCSQSELTEGNPVFDNYIAVSDGLEFPDAGGQYERVLTEGFPLEREMQKDDSLLLEDASEEVFENWDAWRIPELFIDRKQTYYTPWQVIELYDVISTHHVYSRSPRTEDVEWSMSRKLHAWKHSNKMADPIHPIDFVPDDADVEKRWPSPWSAWKNHFQKLADFQWCQCAESRLHWKLVYDQKNAVESWEKVHGYLKIAAKRHTHGTTLDEWIRLINALYALARHFDEREKQRLSEFVVKILNYAADLLKNAYDLSTIKIVELCDGKSFPPTGSWLVSDKQMRLLYLLDPVEWVFRYQLKHNVKHLAGIALPFNPEISNLKNRALLTEETVTSFLHMLRTDKTQALTSPMIEWYLLLFLDDNSHSTHIRRLGVLRTLLSSMESETRRWFKADSMREVFEKAFPSKDVNGSGIKGWQDFYDRDWKELWEATMNDTKVIRKISNVEELIQVASVLHKHEKTERLDPPKNLLGIHLLMAYYSRNWNAHVGDNPPRFQKELERFMFRSVLRTLIVLWHLRPQSSSN